MSHRHNVEEFPVVEARFLRFVIEAPIGDFACFDEIEIFGPENDGLNFALADQGARVTASGSLGGYNIHALRYINDGIYGNAHSWICDTPTGWVQFEWPAPVKINRLIWSRDRENKFQDRLVSKYRVEVALDPGKWRTVASSADRPPPVGLPSVGPTERGLANRFTPSMGETSKRARPAAREYVLETWQTAQGLPANMVTAILQARDGWLWVGTTNGLARFDGLRFTTLGESQGLPSLRVTCLLEDRDGVLWIGTQLGGLARLKDGRFENIPIGPSANQSVFSLAEDRRGSVWIAATGGLYEYRDGVSSPRSKIPPRQITADPLSDGIWILQANKILRQKDNHLEVIDSALDPARFTSLSAFALDAHGAIWFGGANEYVTRIQDGQTKSFADATPVLSSVLWTILPVSNGDVWLGSAASGLARLRGENVLAITTDDDLPANGVLALCEDREGNLWAGTNGGGLTRLRPRQVTALTMADGLTQNSVTAMVQDSSGAVWIGTNGGGLNRWDGKKVEEQKPSYMLENETISALTLTSDGALWIGAWNTGLSRLLRGEIEFASPNLPEAIKITSYCLDRHENLWIGTQDTGPLFLSNEKIDRHPALKSLSDEPITAIVVDAQNAVWFATAGHGVIRFDSDNKLSKWTSAEGLASNFVRTLHIDQAGTLWAGTSNGLSRWNGRQFESFTASQGLPNAVISQILDDQAGHLWLGTNGGIARVPFRSFDEVRAGRATRLTALALDLSDGLPGLECTGGYHPAGLRLADGRLCFGTAAGLAVLDPARFPARPPPPIFIEEASLGEQALPIPTAGSEIVIPAKAGALKIGFTALNYTAPQRTRFRYKMDGLETAWTENGANRSASYPHLPSGNYRFILQASQDGGAWSEPGSVIAVRMLAPWWHAPWAVATGALATAALVATIARLITRRRYRFRLREIEQNLALERERSRIARDIHDQLGANLTQIGLLSVPGRGPVGNVASMSQRFAAISRTTNELMQAVDGIVWAINPKHATVENLARYLACFADDFFSSTPLHLRLRVPPELPATTLSAELRHNLVLATREALNNAVRHAEASEVRLALTAENGVLAIVITDDGCGFDPAVRANGDGLENLQRRMAESGGSCQITSQPGAGTTIELTVPLPV